MQAKSHSISTFLREHRLKKKLSQSELQNMVFGNRTDGQFISNIERNLCQIPVRHIKKMSEVLDVEATEILNRMIDDYATNLRNEVFNESSQLSNQTTHQL